MKTGEVILVFKDLLQVSIPDLAVFERKNLFIIRWEITAVVRNLIIAGCSR